MPTGTLNEFVIRCANVNGTGSASANTLLAKAFYRMGLPIAAKNMFPSNIQGLPTWFEIRVSGQGYRARSGRVDLAVAMNAQTYAQDLAEVSPGGYLLYDSTWPLDPKLHRDDVTFLGVPLARMCNEIFSETRERILMKNIAYVGALAALMNMDEDVIRALLKEKFGRKQALMDSNQQAVDLGFAGRQARAL